jgi:2,3,4,5-tetrahydropyridine-2-carboxylate N-succinyltransferase
MGLASGIGLANISAAGTVLDVWFPQPQLRSLNSSENLALRQELSQLEGEDRDREVHRKVIDLEIDTDRIPTSTADVYLRLHLLSHRLVKPMANLSREFLVYCQTSFGPQVGRVSTKTLNKPEFG